MIEYVLLFVLCIPIILIIIKYIRKKIRHARRKELRILHERKCIPKSILPMLTSRNNIHIKAIEKESGAHIRILHDEKAEDRSLIVCLVSGNREKVTAAHALIDGWIEDCKHHVTREIWIPTEILGHIIGKQGKRIKAVVITSRVDIKVCNQRGASLRSLIKITGTIEGIEMAKGLIKNLIDLYLTKGIMKLIDKRRIAAMKKRNKKRRQRNNKA